MARRMQTGPASWWCWWLKAPPQPHGATHLYAGSNIVFFWVNIYLEMVWITHMEGKKMHCVNWSLVNFFLERLIFQLASRISTFLNICSSFLNIFEDGEGGNNIKRNYPFPLHLLMFPQSVSCCRLVVKMASFPFCFACRFFKKHN